jgi:hypothetical protein
MPYYVGAGEPEWDEYLSYEFEVSPPLSLFKYVEPWEAKSVVVRFHEIPGPEPSVPPPPTYPSRPYSKPGFWGRVRGQKPVPIGEIPNSAFHQYWEDFRKWQTAACAHALWEVSTKMAACLAAGVKRVFGSYDGGGDESFTHITAVQLSDGKIIAPGDFDKKIRSLAPEALIEKAVFGVMARFDAGEFCLRGAVIIDFEACTITDEANADIVFGEKTLWDL